MEDGGWRKEMEDGVFRHPPFSILYPRICRRALASAGRATGAARLGGDLRRGDGSGGLGGLAGGGGFGGDAGGGRRFGFLLRPVTQPLHLDVRVHRMRFNELRGVVQHAEEGGEILAVDKE